MNDLRTPGAVCRRLGYPDGINEEFAREIRAQQQARELEKYNAFYDHCRELQKRAAEDKAEREAIREQVRKAKRVRR